MVDRSSGWTVAWLMISEWWWVCGWVAVWYGGWWEGEWGACLVSGEWVDGRAVVVV